MTTRSRPTPPRTVPRTVYVVPHTHWDREWYEPFESFRVRLVAVVDRVLELLANDPDYPSFTLDGQAIVLRDYLEVRPEREAELRRRVEEGRLHVGPWYVLADEFLVSPEALVRNLALGVRTCRALGGSLPVAYTPDSFGHVAQLPLLAAGFGLGAIVFERGVGDEGERLGGEFLWETVDGAEAVFTVHLLATYSAAAALGHRDWEMADPFDPELAERHARAALYGPNGAAGRDAAHLPAWLRDSLARIEGGAAAYARGEALLLLNGSDHLFPQADLPAALRTLRERLPEFEFRHGDLGAYVAHARASAGALERHRGELRGGRYHHVLGGVLSARLYLKQANDAAQTRLEKITEPLAALAWTAGAPYPQALLDHAWRTLLANHPHDSICGCSIDAVHDAMLTRFAAVHHVAAPLERRAEAHLAGPAGSAALTVFNPHPFPLRRVVDVQLTLPDGAETLRAVAADGGVAAGDLRPEPRYLPGRSDVVEPRATLSLRAELPPLGFASWGLEPGAAGAPPADAVRVAERDEGFRVENGLLVLEVDADGRVALGVPGGELQPLELRFEDEGDAGDSYDFSPVDAPPIVIDAPEEPYRIDRGDLRATIRLAYHAEVPLRLSEDRRSREGSVALPIEVDLVVEADRPSLGALVRLDNRAEDHRLRLRIATGRHSDHVIAEGHFELRRRPLRPPEGRGWHQRPQGTNPQRRFVAVPGEDGRGDGGGLALLNRGLPEYEAIPPQNGSGRGVDLAVTLLRCVGWLSRDDLASRPQGAGPALPAPGAQCPGRHAFELALMPLPAEGWRAALLREADIVSAPPRVRLGDRPMPTRSFLRLEPPLVMTALKRADAREGLIVRVWNPTPQRIDARLEIGFPVAEAHETRLDETRLRPLPLDGDALPLELAARAVRTVELVPEPQPPPDRRP